MSMPVLILIASQVLYASGDFMGRVYVARYGFCAPAFLSWWILAFR